MVGRNSEICVHFFAVTPYRNPAVKRFVQRAKGACSMQLQMSQMHAPTTVPPAATPLYLF